MALVEQPTNPIVKKKNNLLFLIFLALIINLILTANLVSRYTNLIVAVEKEQHLQQANLELQVVIIQKLFGIGSKTTPVEKPKPNII